MKKFSKIYLFLISIAFLGQSCDSILDNESPQALDSEKALTTKIGIDAAVIGLYDYIQSTRVYGRDLFAIPDALADNGRATNKSGRLNAEYLNQPNAHMSNWQNYYFMINQANLIFDNIQSVSDMSSGDKAQAEGACHFLRALAYFDLVKAYAYIPTAPAPSPAQERGGVPIVSKGIKLQDDIKLPSRNSVDEVYTQIYSDLNSAIAKLPLTGSRAFATGAAARALFSRVALYRGDYAACSANADMSIASNIATLSTNGSYITDWRQQVHPEAIFDLSFQQITEAIGPNESLQTSYTTLASPGNRGITQGFGDLVPTPALLTALGITRSGTTVTRGTDVRAQLYELGTTGRGAAEIECTKFIGKNGFPNQDNTPVLRISEMYLNRAEAHFRLNKRDSAIINLNVIRTRAGLPAMTADSARIAGALLLEEILDQRRLELAFEGHRFFDFKRLGRTIVKPSPATNLPFSDNRVLAPIPVREISANPNLRQNFGY